MVDLYVYSLELFVIVAYNLCSFELNFISCLARPLGSEDTLNLFSVLLKI